jgi:hypothetical protein
MVVTYEHQAYVLDFEAITVRQAVEIYNYTGLTIADLHRVFADGNGSTEDVINACLSAFFWLMTGCEIPFPILDFKVAKLAKAIFEGSQADGKMREAAQRRANDGKTVEEYWAERASAPEVLDPVTGPDIGARAEVQKHYRSIRDSAKWFEEWYTNIVAEVRMAHLWDFGEALGMSAHDVDDLRLGDFFNYCTCLRQWRENEIKKEKAKAEARNNQRA